METEPTSLETRPFTKRVVSDSGIPVTAARVGDTIAAVTAPEAKPANVALMEKRARWASLLVPGPNLALAMVVVAATLCRLLWLNAPDRALVFDEAYYVNASRKILAWEVPKGMPYAGEPAGHDPNAEHPPLGKLTIATSMRMLGDRPIGWRLPSLAAGTASILLVYAVAVAAGANPWTGVVGATLLALDNLAIVHSRIATLDMPMVALLLLATWLALRRRPALAGVACGLAVLFKMPGVYGVAALLLFYAGRAAWRWRDTGAWPRDLVRNAVLLSSACALTSFSGLWLLDLAVGSYHTPWEHLGFILGYGLKLVNVDGPQAQESYPWQWLLNEVQMTYLRADEQVLADGALIATRAVVDFRGAMNPLVIGAAPLGVSYCVWRCWRHRDTLALWVVAWVVATYLPYFPLAMLHHRVAYIFYFLPTLPAVALAIAKLATETAWPRVVLWSYLAMVLVGCIGYFPFRLLGHH